MKDKYCQICGKEITAPRRRHFCSDECRMKAARIRANGGRDLPPLKEVICPICGKKFKQHQRGQLFCSEECRVKGRYRVTFIRGWIKRICMDYGFVPKNEEKIIRAKLRFFHDGNMRRCPCDAKNPERYCGSALCIHDTVHYGHCHCSLFHLPDGKKSIEELDKEK